MKFKVNLAWEDIIQFQIFHTMNTTMNKWLKYLFLIVGIVLISISLMGLILIDIGIIYIICCIIGIITLIFPFTFYPLLVKYIVISSIPKDSIKHMIGTNIYELGEKRISIKTELTYGEMDYKVIKRFVNEKDYLYIYNTSISALVIPKRDLDNEVIQKIITSLERKMNSME